jgi:hypothetical protein
MAQRIRRKKSNETPNSTPAATPGTEVVRDDGSRPAADHIRIRAYEIFQARNGEPGDALADWIRAEREATSGSEAER